MVSSKTFAVATALTAASLVSAFDPQSMTNIVTYYGQGANQPRLRDFCQDTTLDIINIGFVNVFPDQGKAGWPGTNFGNQCNGETYTIGGLETELLSGCSQIAEDIPICQAAGKKVFLSLGGAYPATQKLLSQKTAELFAEFLWFSFGPVNELSGLVPRPFGNATVDGFDFDIEHNGGFGYSYMVNRFRELYKEVPDRTFYISGAPQCTIPDAQLGDAITNSAFDFVWVQFYNTPGCSARDFVEGTKNGFNFGQWVNVIKKSANPNAKLFVGLPASPSAAGSQYYLTPEEVQPLVEKYIKMYPKTFGGIMLWEATESLVNQIDGGSYADSMKEILKPWAPPKPTTTSSSAIPSSTTTTTTTTTPVPPTSTSVVPTTTTTTSSSSAETPSSTPVTTSSSSSSSSSTETPSSTPVTTSSSTTAKTPSSTPVIPTPSTTIKTPSSTPVIPTSKTTSSSVPVIPTTTHTPTPSPSTSKSTSSHPTIPTGSTSSTIPGSSAPVPSSSVTSKTTTKPDQTSSTGKPTGATTTGQTTGTTTTGKPTGATTTSSGSPGQSGTVTSSSGITSAPVTTPSTTAPPSTDEPTTITTVIVTSYTSICPTGFTTITTTYTTTYCPATQTATATQPPSGPGAVTSAPAPPEGWTTTVTVCTQCAATPTTVTLTVPCETTAPAVPTTVAPVKPSATETLPEGWTTTVTVCTECGPTPTTVTVTVPITVVPTIPSRPTGVEPVVPPVHTTSRPLIWGTGGIPRPSSSTLYVKPSSTGQRAPVAPTNAPEDVSPVFTGAAPRVGLGHGMVALVAVLGAFLW